jgi:hypothetical protein
LLRSWLLAGRAIEAAADVAEAAAVEAMVARTRIAICLRYVR